MAKAGAVEVVELIRMIRVPYGSARDRYRIEAYIQDMQKHGPIWIHRDRYGHLIASATLRGRNALQRLKSFERNLPSKDVPTPLPPNRQA